MKTTLRRYVKDLRTALNNAAVNKSLQLGKGQCATIEDYKKTVGYISGLEAAGEVAEQMLRGIEDASRDADSDLPEMPQVAPQRKKRAGKGK